MRYIHAYTHNVFALWGSGGPTRVEGGGGGGGGVVLTPKIPHPMVPLLILNAAGFIHLLLHAVCKGIYGDKA